MKRILKITMADFVSAVLLLITHSCKKDDEHKFPLSPQISLTN
jgi:hypothetical protein